MTVVHHTKLNIDFVTGIEPDVFVKRDDKDIIECFEGSGCTGNCRKFLKGYLTLKNVEPDQIPKVRKKRSTKKEKDTEEMELSKEPTCP